MEIIEVQKIFKRALIDKYKGEVTSTPWFFTEEDLNIYINLPGGSQFKKYTLIEEAICKLI